MKIAAYDTDLTHDQWHLLRRFLPAAKKRGRPRTALREVINAILYLVKTGAQWRLLPKRWVVERTFGWLMHCRRLVRDREQTAASAAGWIYLAMIRLMLRRLA